MANTSGAAAIPVKHAISVHVYTPVTGTTILLDSPRQARWRWRDRDRSSYLSIRVKERGSPSSRLEKRGHYEQQDEQRLTTDNTQKNDVSFKAIQQSGSKSSETTTKPCSCHTVFDYSSTTNDEGCGCSTILLSPVKQCIAS